MTLASWRRIAHFLVKVCVESVWKLPEMDNENKSSKSLYENDEGDSPERTYWNEKAEVISPNDNSANISPRCPQIIPRVRLRG